MNDIEGEPEEPEAETGEESEGSEHGNTGGAPPVEPERPDEREQAISEQLETTLSVSPVGTDLHLAVTVENTDSEPVVLSFRTSQRVDFVAHRAGEEYWRWGDDQMFTQAFGEETLEPGEHATYEGEWERPPDGKHVLRGELTAKECEGSAELVVELGRQMTVLRCRSAP